MEYSSVALAVVGVIGCAGLAAYQLSSTCKSTRKAKAISETTDSKGKKQPKKDTSEKPQQQQKQKQKQQQPKQQQQPKPQSPKQQEQQKPEQKPSAKVAAAPAKQEVAAKPQPAAKPEEKPAPKQDKKAAQLAVLQEQLNRAIAQGDMDSVAKIAGRMAEVKAQKATPTAAESEVLTPSPDVVEAQKKELEAILAAEGEWTTIPKRKEKTKERKTEEKDGKEAAAASTSTATAGSKKSDKADAKKEEEEKKEEKKKEKKTIEVTIDPSKRSKLIGPDASVIKRITELYPECRLDVPKKDAPKQDVVKITGDPVEIEAVKRIVLDLTTRGFSKTLDPQICDSHVIIPTDKVSLIFGRQGATINAIQRSTKTSITKLAKTEQSKAKAAGREPQDTLIIVGEKEGVEAAKRAIRQTMADGYSRLSYPADWVTIPLEFPAEHRSKLIGAGGGRIKKLKDIYQCDFKFPESGDNLLTLIGPAGDSIQRAQAAVMELLDQFTRPPQNRVLDGFEDEDADDAGDQW